jgi:predicted kinase
MASHHLPEVVRAALETATSQNQRTVLLTCGSSGAGKSTFSRSITAQYPNFIRLSIDAYIFQDYGVYGKDYPEEKYEELQDEAREWVRSRLGEIVGEGKRDVVLDLSFWNKGDRERWREMIERGGGGR